MSKNKCVQSDTTNKMQGAEVATPARVAADGANFATALGTPPSNTVPLNYNPKTFKSLRYGIDSLYVSYPGVIADDPC